jgi:hypothetical protein
VSRDDRFDSELARLYALPLGEFTAARNALARELKSSGDADGAKRVKELKKPTRSAGAINRAVRANRKAAKELVAAAENLRDAQERLLAGGGREAVEKASERERAAVDRFMSAVESELQADGGATAPMLERARSTLHALPSDPELHEEFEAGRITEDREAVGFGALSLGAAPPATKAAPAPEKKAESAERKEAQRRLRRAERDLEMAEKRFRRAQGRVEKAQEQLDAANVAVSEAEEAVSEATKARDEAAEDAGG